LGAIDGNVACKCKAFSVISTTLDPTIQFSHISDVIIDNDDITVVTSNVSDGSTSGFLTVFSSIAQKQQSKAYAAFNIAPNEAIADSGATQIFVMEGTLVLNKQKTTCPLKVALADGCRVLSTHMCDIVIPGLATTLVGNIVPELSIASLFGIRVLMEAGCMVKFNNKKCVIKYNDKTILVGMKDPTTDLWTLSIIGPAGKTTHFDDEAEQDPFVTLREEFLDTTSKASFSNTSMLAVPMCASAQACASRAKATKSLKKTSIEPSGFLCPHYPNQSQQHQVCPSILV
jgi:hypothetical protein